MNDDAVQAEALATEIRDFTKAAIDPLVASHQKKKAGCRSSSPTLELLPGLLTRQIFREDAVPHLGVDGPPLDQPALADIDALHCAPFHDANRLPQPLRLRPAAPVEIEELTQDVNDLAAEQSILAARSHLPCAMSDAPDRTVASAVIHLAKTAYTR